MSRVVAGGAAGGDGTASSGAAASTADATSGRWAVRSTTAPAPVLYARFALGAAFLSAVAARFGLWDGRPEPFAGFVAYTGEVLSFLPRAVIPACAEAATIAETTLGVLLVLGVRLRETAAASAVLLAAFGVSMAISGGIKSPLDGSVFSASAAALLLSASSADGDGASRATSRKSLAGSSGSGAE